MATRVARDRAAPGETLDRFTYLLGGDNREQLFGEERVEQPPDVRCGFTVDPGPLTASACQGRHVVEPCFSMLKQRQTPEQGVNALNLPMFSPASIQ